MKLYQVHCGFYDLDLCDGVYESHVNFFVVAESFEDARVKAREIPELKAKKMHVDGIVEIQAVQGAKIVLEKSAELQGRTILISHRHRELAPKSAPATLPTL